MGIQPVGQGSQATSVVATTQKQSHQPTPSALPEVTVKKDAAIISERAKDLAALKAGKAAAEEAKESVAAKLMEGDGD
jgi:hypothetical protein